MTDSSHWVSRLDSLLPASARPVIRSDAIWSAHPPPPHAPEGSTSATRTVYCGLPPHDAIVSGCTVADIAWLRSLDGLSTWPEVVRRAHEWQAARAGGLVRAFLQVGALDDAGSMPNAWRLTQERKSGNRASLLMTGCTPWQANDLIDRRQARTVAVVGMGPLADSTALRCRGAGMDCLQVASIDEPRTPGIHLALIVGAGHADVVDRVDSAWHRIDHLPVRCWGATARVGPLVRPGVTSCLRCAHLHARDRYPAWAERSWAAAHVMQEHTVHGDRITDLHAIDDGTAHLAIALAVRLAQSLCDDDSRCAQDLGAAFDIGPDHLLPIRRAQPAHPLCGCQWDALTRMGIGGGDMGDDDVGSEEFDPDPCVGAPAPHAAQ